MRKTKGAVTGELTRLCTTQMHKVEADLRAPHAGTRLSPDFSPLRGTELVQSKRSNSECSLKEKGRKRGKEEREQPSQKVCCEQGEGAEGEEIGMTKWVCKDALSASNGKQHRHPFISQDELSGGGLSRAPVGAQQCHPRPWHFLPPCSS